MIATIAKFIICNIAALALSVMVIATLTREAREGLIAVFLYSLFGGVQILINAIVIFLIVRRNRRLKT